MCVGTAIYCNLFLNCASLPKMEYKFIIRVTLFCASVASSSSSYSKHLGVLHKNLINFVYLNVYVFYATQTHTYRRNDMHFKKMFFFFFKKQSMSSIFSRAGIIYARERSLMQYWQNYRTRMKIPFVLVSLFWLGFVLMKTGNARGRSVLITQMYVLFYFYTQHWRNNMHF